MNESTSYTDQILYLHLLLCEDNILVNLVKINDLQLYEENENPIGISFIFINFC